MVERTTIYTNEHGTYIEPTKDDRLLAMLLYLSSFVTTIVGPLIIWLLKREESPFIDHHGKEYLNFLISYVIYSFIAGILVIILIGALILFVIGIAAVVVIILAGIKAYQGEYYRIPFIIRIIK